MEPHAQQSRFQIEKLEERIAPAIGKLRPMPPKIPIIIKDGILEIDPPGESAGHAMLHRHPEPGVIGLNMAEANSAVVNWTPT
jgi:hypothetical protein